MDGLRLLMEAREAGLSVEVDGDLLRVRGPKRLEPLALRLLACKPNILAALGTSRRVPEGPQETQNRPTTSATDRPGRMGRPRKPADFLETPLTFGDVADGWTPAAWAAELRRKADRCDTYRPDVADWYRRWAGNVEKRMKNEKGLA